MSLSIERYNPSAFAISGSKMCHPALTVINRKTYRTDSWQEFLKIFMYSYMYRQENNSFLGYMNTPQPGLRNQIILTDSAEESSAFVKFSPELYVRCFNKPLDNCIMLNKLAGVLDEDRTVIYMAVYDNAEDLKQLEEERNALAETLDLKNGSTRYLIASINGKVLNSREKFIRRVEREFDKKVLIGDIDIRDDEETLKWYMHNALNAVISKGLLTHEKVFAYGLVRAALKNYSNKTFWPHISKEYDIDIPVNYQSRINEKFREIMIENGKLYENDTMSFVQNICMHAFVCDKCADQFFDYIFDFWRIDLSRSIENSIDDSGNDLFGILIEEISNNGLVNIPDIMIHTTMALKLNPGGCKNRFRRILRMIDDCYWNDSDFSSSTNRITILFNEWKNKSTSSFAKEMSRSVGFRKSGRREKLLSRPVIEYLPDEMRFRLILPKQILRNCSEEEHPVWKISTVSGTLDKEPNLMQGRAFLFTEECTVDINNEDLFEDFEILLLSEKASYYRKRINASKVRFFNSINRNTEFQNGYLIRDISYALTEKEEKLTYVDGVFSEINKENSLFDVYVMTPSEGDVFILPDNHAVSVGRPLAEGIIGQSSISGVKAYYNEKSYSITAKKNQLFFKTDAKRFHGTSLKVFFNDRQTRYDRLCEKEYIEFKLDEKLSEIYGYIIDLKHYINEDGFYRIELSIPGMAVRAYSICYINDFSFSYDREMYIFRDTVEISFPAHLNIVTDQNWNCDSVNKKLGFSISEDERQLKKNDYVKDRELRLKYALPDRQIDMVFDLPVLFWKYKIEEEWSYEKPGDTNIKSMPARIYVSGNIDFANSRMHIHNGEDLDETDLRPLYEKNSSLYYFRMADMKQYLNRDITYRDVHFEAGNTSERFFSIACRSVVRSKSISGDFKNNTIYGHFDIFGSSDYMVTVRREDTVIEENIPLVNGEFQINCHVEEGKYRVTLYEIEEDESGFDSMSYELETYLLQLTDARKFSGCNAYIRYIKNKKNRLADLSLDANYAIKDLHLLDYETEVYDIADPYIWDDYDEEELKGFIYYRGTLGVLLSYSNSFKPLEDVMVIFHNMQNTSEVIINTIDKTDNNNSSLMYDPEQEILLTDESRLSIYAKWRVRLIDDDKYRIGIYIGRE